MEPIKFYFSNDFFIKQIFLHFIFFSDSKFSILNLIFFAKYSNAVNNKITFSLQKFYFKNQRVQINEGFVCKIIIFKISQNNQKKYSTLFINEFNIKINYLSTNL